MDNGNGWLVLDLWRQWVPTEAEAQEIAASMCQQEGVICSRAMRDQTYRPRSTRWHQRRRRRRRSVIRPSTWWAAEWFTDSDQPFDNTNARLGRRGWKAIAPSWGQRQCIAPWGFIVQCQHRSAYGLEVAESCRQLADSYRSERPERGVQLSLLV